MKAVKAKEKALILFDEGKWVQLAILILRFGTQIIEWIRQNRKKDYNGDIPTGS